MRPIIRESLFWLGFAALYVLLCLAIAGNPFA